MQVDFKKEFIKLRGESRPMNRKIMDKAQGSYALSVREMLLLYKENYLNNEKMFTKIKLLLENVY